MNRRAAWQRIAGGRHDRRRAREAADSRLARPRFLGIGAQKAGTTWLHENLRAHAGLFLPPVKEIHYFDRHLDRPFTWYAAHFSDAGDRLPGEITPAYGHLAPGRIRLVRRLLPDLRLILLLRNPIDRAWSHAVMQVAVTTGRDVASVPEDEFRAHFRSASSRRRGDYLAVIDRWTRCFGADRLCIDFHDSVAAEPQALLTRVLAHLGVGPPGDWSAFPLRTPVNAGPGLALPPRLRADLVALHRRPLRRLAERLGGAARRWAEEASA